MSRQADSSYHLKDAIVAHLHQDGLNGSPAFGQSDLSINAANNGPARIVVVEDDPVMLRMVGDYLEQHNMRCVSASGRQEMVHHFAATEPDLVVLDLRLGQEDGFDLTDPNGTEVVLTKGEYALLTAFLDSPQRPLSREHLLQATRVHEDIFDRSIDVQILRLRRKLETDATTPSIIRTERGIGYVFGLPVQPF